MALARLSTPVDNITTLTAALWINEFDNLYNNALSFISPLTGNLDFNNFQALNMALQSSTLAGLPAAGTAGRLARVTDNVRGVWMDQGSQWFQLSSYTINVREFGAKGDGVTSDSTAIQGAINAANTAGGGTVYLPIGTYLLTVRLTMKSNVALVGAGYGSILKVAPTINTAEGQALITGIGVGGTSNLLYSDFQIDGNKANVAVNGSPNEQFQTALYLDEVTNAVVRNVWVHDAVENGITVANSSTIVIIDGCRVENNGKAGAAGGRGIDFNISPTYFRVVDNYIAGNLVQGILIQSEGGNHADSFVIANNIVRNNGQEGIDLTDNQTSGSAVQDIFIRNAVISGNIIQGNARRGIRISENGTANGGGFKSIAQNITISGNTIQGNTNEGILFAAINAGLVRRVAILNNNIQDNSTWGMNVSGTSVSDTFIDGNNLLNNTSGAITDTGTRTIQGINKGDITTTLVFPTAFDTSPLSANAIYNDMFARALVKFRGSDGATQGKVNVDSVTRSATGTYSVTIGTDFVDTSYQIVVTALSATAVICTVTSVAAGTIGVLTTDAAGTAVDPTSVFVVAFGRQ